MSELRYNTKQKSHSSNSAMESIIDRIKNTLNKNQETNTEIVPIVSNKKFKIRIYLLKCLPWLLIVSLIASFFWDFPNHYLIWNGYKISLTNIIKTVSIGGFIGFFTNWLAVNMLFKPIKKRPLLGQGLIPAQKQLLAIRLSEIVENDLLNATIINQYLSSLELNQSFGYQLHNKVTHLIKDQVLRQNIKEGIIHYVEELIKNDKIRKIIVKNITKELQNLLEKEGRNIERITLKVYALLSGQTINQIVEKAFLSLPEWINEKLNSIDNIVDDGIEDINIDYHKTNQIITEFIIEIVNHIDIKAMVYNNLNNYNEQRLSDVIKNTTNESLKYIQYLGALFGIIGGFFLWHIWASLVVFGTISILIYGLDILILKMKKNRSR